MLILSKLSTVFLWFGLVSHFIFGTEAFDCLDVVGLTELVILGVHSHHRISSRNLLVLFVRLRLVVPVRHSELSVLLADVIRLVLVVDIFARGLFLKAHIALVLNDLLMGIVLVAVAVALEYVLFFT